MNLNAALDAFVNKFHIVLGTVCQAAIIVFHFRTGKDLGPGVVSSVYAFYALLAGHAFTYQMWPDTPIPNSPATPATTTNTVMGG